MKRIGMLVAAVALVVSVAGCEPKMAITAGNDNTTGTDVACGMLTHIVGKVTPAIATAKVVLQTTSGGKWVDMKGWPSYETSHVADRTLRTANVSKSTGDYSIPLIVEWLETTKHLRVRSAGGTASRGFYLKSWGTEGDC